MANRRSFKTDDSFLEKLCIGAFGTKAVIHDLSRQGHKPIELERGSTNFKIWKNIKIKRVRVPDILCLNCGLRIEARAKTKPEISMSHSVSDPDRGWDKGLRDNDAVALSISSKTGNGPTDWCIESFIQYLPVGELRKAFRENRVVLEKPKGAEEGFELRVVWPSSIASNSGKVIDITPSRLTFRRTSDKRVISLSLFKKGLQLMPLVRVGDEIVKSQILASVIPVSSSFPCSSKATDGTFLSHLTSYSVEDRYAAVKALSNFYSLDAVEVLKRRMNDDTEHIYVRLEAAAGLARFGLNDGIDFINQILNGEYLEHRLEAVIILGEIDPVISHDTLISVLLDKRQHPDIRAGAAWALGEQRRPSSADALIESFLELSKPIRIEAARALRKITKAGEKHILSRLPSSEEDQRAGIAWAISKSGDVEVDALIGAMVDDDARRWVAYILGTQNQEEYLGEIELLRSKDPEVYFAVTVLWKIFSSWIYGLEEY
jgi:hypothetical protein